MARAKARRRQHAYGRFVGEVEQSVLGNDERHLAAIHRLLEEASSENERVGLLSQLMATTAMLAGVTMYMASRAPLFRAAKGAHGHTVLLAASPDPVTIALVTLALVTSAVALARCIRGLAVGVAISITPVAIAVCISLAALGAAADPAMMIAPFWLAGLISLEYVALHRRARQKPALLPVSNETVAAIQVPTLVVTAGLSGLLLYTDIDIPSRYRGHPALLALGTLVALAGPTATAILMRGRPAGQHSQGVRRMG